MAPSLSLTRSCNMRRGQCALGCVWWLMAAFDGWCTLVELMFWCWCWWRGWAGQLTSQLRARGDWWRSGRAIIREYERKKRGGGGGKNLDKRKREKEKEGCGQGKERTQLGRENWRRIEGSNRLRERERSWREGLTHEHSSMEAPDRESDYGTFMLRAGIYDFKLKTECV